MLATQCAWIVPCSYTSQPDRQIDDTMLVIVATKFPERVKINCQRPINCNLDRYQSVRGDSGRQWQLKLPPTAAPISCLSTHHVTQQVLLSFPLYNPRCTAYSRASRVAVWERLFRRSQMNFGFMGLSRGGLVNLRVVTRTHVPSSRQDAWKCSVIIIQCEFK